ncbi:TonB-dependent receptor [Parvularcula sp. LCG005]|uniref:TonB-dependent receptor n=1 Tax=Parvularcula sp. LCG005 TaxID=3078805 RepID=UPI002942370B|nr:TonB-dependent receptor [Parvularcula sp. LCG005]WOI52403.1 TonB-dependent receptor [Parvularcula sp. LCG005]
MNKRSMMNGVLLGASLTAMAAASPAAFAQDTTEDEIVVTGFRASLAEALAVKKEATGAVDAIVAEDIADFPDLNLAESLQRVPGVAITRDSGEGRQITVRGLSGQYTRVRVNGMETIAATGGEGSVNRGRDFDFNVFASELFNNIIVRKTASADIDEGSLGATVDLNTGRPFNYKDGTTLVLSAQGQYNELIEDFGPRVAGLFAYNDPNGVWGVSASAAYSSYATSELGQNTVRWQKARFQSVEGVDCLANPTDTGCDTVTNAFHPRIPRYGEIALERERLGLTTGLQLRLDDATTLSVDGLYSKLDASRSEYWGEVLFRGNEGGMDVIDYTYDADTNNLNSMTVNNAWVRMENFKKAWTTDFYQVGATLDHDFSDTFRMQAFAGKSQSDTEFPYEITFMYDDRDHQNFSYDYTDDKFPTITFGGDSVLDPSTFQLSELRDRPSGATHGFTTGRIEAEWDFTENLSLEGGVSWKEFTFDTYGYRRDQGVCGDLFDCDTDDDNVNDLYGVPATAGLTDIFNFNDDTGAGSTTSWAIPSLSGWSDYFDLPNIEATLDQGSTSKVTEESVGAFLQLNGDVPVGEMRLKFDAGVRYVETKQNSSGYNSGTLVDVTREPYEDTLPSANVALFVTPDFVLRASAAQVMTRPGLGNLSPGGSVDSFNYRVSYANPSLNPTRANNFDASAEWYFADEALLSFAFFTKEIESFPISTESTNTYASTGLPLTLLVPTSPTAQNPEGGPAESCNPNNGGSGCWTIRSLGDGPGADIQGFEVGLQLPFSTFVEGTPLLEDMGIVGNYTYVDSDVDYTVNGQEITERLLGLSNVSYNATVYYENDRFSARLAAAYRDEYLSGTSGNSNTFEGYGETFNLDFSSSYELTDNIELSFEALNLTDDYQDRWTDIYAKRRYEYDHTGRVFLVGARWSMN